LPPYSRKRLLYERWVVFKFFWTQLEVVFACFGPWTLLVTEFLRLIHAVL
jgi:hypothetical protein